MKTLKEYELRFKTLPEGKHEFAYRLDNEFFSNYEDSMVKGGDVAVEVDILSKRDTFEFVAVFHGFVVVECDRCLGDISYPIDTTYRTTIVLGEEFDDSNDELLTIPERDNAFDISGLLYDTVVLEIPLRKVHKDGECDSVMSELFDAHNAESVENEENDDY